MKKVFMLLAMMAMPFAMQAQTKFHDAEANEAKGAVKSLTVSMMGMDRTYQFSEDGKIVSGDISDAKYDADGYIQSAKMNMQGQSSEIKFIWENGQLKGQVLEVMGNELKMTNVYDENGVATGVKIDMGGQEMEQKYTDIKLDDHGNWISRTSSMMGQEMVTTRKIEYYE